MTPSATERSPADWLAVFRDLADAVEGAVGPHLGDRRAEGLGEGAGGDVSFPVDRVAEEAAMAVLAKVGDLRLVTEETGVHDIGEPRATVVLDPVDGSHNARTGIPFHAVSAALCPLDARLGTVEAALVRNLATGQTYEAEKGGGARLDGEPCRPSDVTERWTCGFELWSPDEEHGSPDRAFWDRVVHVMERARRVRGLGSLALDLALVASGSLDVFVDVRGFARTLDTSAGYLLVKEAGGVVTDDRGRSLDDAPLDLTTTRRLVAAGNQAVHAEVLELLR